MYLSWFKHLPVEGHPGYFQFGVLQIKLAYTFMYTFLYRNSMIALVGSYTFNFLRDYQIVF